MCADSYFSSVETEHVLGHVGTRFIGVVKTASRGFPVECLSEKVMKKRGDHYWMVAKNEDQVKDFMAVLWVDGQRRYFIS